MTSDPGLRWDHGLVIGLIVGFVGGILGTQWWTGRYASTPALPGWVLTVPPSGFPGAAAYAPLSIWRQERAFDSADACEAHRQRLRADSMQSLGQALRHGDLGPETVVEAVATGRGHESSTLMQRAYDAWTSRCVSTVEFSRAREK
jgi:hypothetical protein